jgi:hypothetical protein
LAKFLPLSAIRAPFELDAPAPLPEPRKIASFNINNTNRRLPNLLSRLREAGPRFRARWGDRPSIQS